MVYYKLFSLLLVGAQCVNVHRERLSINTVHVQKLFTDKSRPVYLQCALLCSKVWILSSTWLSACLVLLGCALGDIMPPTVTCFGMASSASRCQATTELVTDDAGQVQDLLFPLEDSCQVV